MHDKRNYPFHPILIKKESPNEGTETNPETANNGGGYDQIKKESPNEGTETTMFGILIVQLWLVI